MTSERVVCQERNLVAIKTVAELVMKLAKVEWNEQLLTSIAATDGTTSRASPPRTWLNEVVGNDEMIDCFRHFYPNVKGRFTCWDQCEKNDARTKGRELIMR